MSLATLKLSDVDRVEIRSQAEQEFEQTLKDLGDSEYDWQSKQLTRTLIPVAASIEEGRICHQNYMYYLTRCWANHQGVVVKPDFIWYTLLCELAGLTKGDPETYRSIFTDSEEKKDIVVPYDGGGFVISLELLINELKQEVPSDVDSFFPAFSTTTMRCETARRAAFADMASPYYDYFMLCCGFPAIDIRGERQDWELLAERWRKLTAMFEVGGAKVQKWFARVQGILDDCVSRLTSADWWKTMYQSEQCGSGGETKISGWFAEIFYEKCDFTKVGNFPPCVATVDYTRINLHDPDCVQKFRMKHGLFFSREEDDLLVPDFGFVLFNQLDEPETFKPEFHEGPNMSNWIAKMEPGNIRSSKNPDVLAKARDVVTATAKTDPGKLGPYQNADKLYQDAHGTT